MSALLEVEDLAVSFRTRRGRDEQTVRAVNGLSFTLEEGETLGLVGESGSGKTVSSLALLGLIPCPPGRIERGRARFDGSDLLALSPRELRTLRGDALSMVFQDPMTSLNPLLTVGRQLTEVVEVHRGMGRREARRLAAQRLGEVGIPSPEARLDAYPHELSGGMRQRVGIAMALMCRPRLLLADEPTTALDVTIQAQILELLADLQERTGMAIVLVTHDLGVVAGMADRVAVMYAGALVESGPTEAVFRDPAHPYTRGLLGSVPRLDDPPGHQLETIEGQPPDLAHLAPGCAFAPRCARADGACTERPPFEALDAPDRSVACVHPLLEARAGSGPGEVR